MWGQNLWYCFPPNSLPYMHTHTPLIHTCTYTHTSHTHSTHASHTSHSTHTHSTYSHTHTCTHHTRAHVHMLTHKHSDTHCMSVPIATCIEWLCEMLKCTCVCEGGRGQNTLFKVGGQFIPPPPPTLTNLQSIPPLPHQKPAWCWVWGQDMWYTRSKIG